MKGKEGERWEEEDVEKKGEGKEGDRGLDPICVLDRGAVVRVFENF